MELLEDPTGGRSFTACEKLFHEAARAAAGLADFGDADYLDGLRVLLASYDEEADLAPAGRAAAAGGVIAALVSRLHSQAGWARHPECLAAPIRRPLVILGLPRTGSTALHRLLACDPALQGLELWLAGAPKPRPPRSEWPLDPAFRERDEATRAILAGQPVLRAIHEMDASLVDECWHLFHQSFASTTFECTSHVPSYTRWWLARDLRGPYRRYRDNLRLIGANDPHRRWLCKDPSHIFNLDVLLETFPDACLVFTHRDPAAAVPSVCSLNSLFRIGYDRAFDPRVHGAAQLEFWAQGMERALALRRAVGPKPFFDLELREIHSDPLAAVRRLYAHFGLPLSDEAERAMRLHCDQNPRGKHGGHDYRAEDFGLEPGRVRERFARYLEAFPLPPER